MGWTLKTMPVGFEALREVMVAGYHPSVARLYDYEDGQLHFSHFAKPDECILLFMAEGNAGITKATEEGIREIVAKYPECQPVDSALIEEWFNDLVWGPDKVTREDERIRTTRNVNRTTEISADWSSIGKIYDAVIPRIRAEIKGITLLGGHSSHSYINGTNMYFNYFYDLIDCEPEEENDKYYFPIISIIVEETLRYGGSIVHHHGIGKARARWVEAEYGTSFPMLRALKDAYDPRGIMNAGTIFPT
jgi:alkyldihydroxyacetonephosphate synthase